jgi:hypothetical protein
MRVPGGNLASHVVGNLWYSTMWPEDTPCLVTINNMSHSVSEVALPAQCGQLEWQMRGIRHSSHTLLDRHANTEHKRVDSRGKVDLHLGPVLEDLDAPRLVFGNDFDVFGELLSLDFGHVKCSRR